MKIYIVQQAYPNSNNYEALNLVNINNPEDIIFCDGNEFYIGDKHVTDEFTIIERQYVDDNGFYSAPFAHKIYKDASRL